MVSIAAHFFQIVMLPGDAQAFLGIDHPPVGRPFNPEKNILKRHHPGIGKQQRRVISWNQRRTRDNLMTPVGKKTAGSCRVSRSLSWRLLFPFASRYTPQ